MVPEYSAKTDLACQFGRLARFGRRFKKYGIAYIGIVKVSYFMAEIDQLYVST